MNTSYLNTTSSDALLKWQITSANIERLELENATTITEINNCLKETDDINGAKIILEHLKNYKLEKRKDFILGVVNSALADIFESDYRLDILPRITKGSAAASQKYDIIFYQNGIEVARNHDLLTSNGGGVLSIASLFFKILIGYIYSKNKFYIFDESLSQVSPQFRQRLSMFLRKFCEEYDFTIVVVSQTEELEESAHLVYEVQTEISSNKIPTMTIKEITGEKPKDNFFFASIKNFQSIKEAYFIYKGFTIIRGPNNSGKSASLRAIESLLFNNFKTDLYPRKNPDGPKLTTEVTFGFVENDTTPPKQVGLKYRKNKVMFLIDGEEYYGKSLAGDKIREAVEEIGFKYIDVKKMYKNFKGPLKDQTERIAYTNQYDGLFLIGSKTADSEKIFSFLFNTEDIALALAKLNEDMHEKNTLYKKLSIQLNESEKNIILYKKELDYFIKIYYYKLIKEYEEVTNNISTVIKKAEFMDKLTTAIGGFYNAVESISGLSEFKRSIESYQNKGTANNIVNDNLRLLIERYNSILEIKHFQDTDNAYKVLTTKSLALSELHPRYIYLSIFADFFSSSERMTDLGHMLDTIGTSKEQLDKDYNLCECGTCSGIGVIPYT